MIKGGDVCITSGFLRIMQGKGIEDITSARHSCKKVSTKDYLISGTGSVFNGEFYGRYETLLPVLTYMNNAADCPIAARKEDNNFPVLLRNEYANGTIYTLTVPDDYADFYKYPQEVLTTIRQYLMEGGDNIGLFLYNNGTFIVESFLDHNTKIKLHIASATKTLIDVRTGKEVLPVLRKECESIYEIPLMPVYYKVFKLV